MSEEIKKVLDMVKEGKITVDEAAQLIDAMGNSTRLTGAAVRKEIAGKSFKIKVDSNDGDKVNINIPVSLAKIAMRFIPTDAKAELKAQNVDLDEIIQAAIEGAYGKFVDIQSSNGDKVEIVVE